MRTNVLDYDIVVNKFKPQWGLLGWLSDQYPWEKYEPIITSAMD